MNGLSAIGMILAKHLGVNGFGHDVRLAWAGFLYMTAGGSPRRMESAKDAAFAAIGQKRPSCRRKMMQIFRMSGVGYVEDRGSVAFAFSIERIDGSPALMPDVLAGLNPMALTLIAYGPPTERYSKT